MKGAFYTNKLSGKVALCLGFRSWGAIGIPLVAQRDGPDKAASAGFHGVWAQGLFWGEG